MRAACEEAIATMHEEILQKIQETGSRKLRSDNRYELMYRGMHVTINR